MKHPLDMAASLLRRQAADSLRRERKLPVGADRNDLRQLTLGLLWLEQQKFKTTVQDRGAALKDFTGANASPPEGSH
jgi:hypothetical protein